MGPTWRPIWSPCGGTCGAHMGPHLGPFGLRCCPILKLGPGCYRPLSEHNFWTLKCNPCHWNHETTGFGKHKSLETTGIWKPLVLESTWHGKPLEFRNHRILETNWNLESMGLKQQLESRSHCKLEATGFWNPQEFINHGNWKLLELGNHCTLEITVIWKPLESRSQWN